MTNDKLFSDVLTNDYNKYKQMKPKERNNAFDFIRGLAVLFMILVHVLGTYSNTYVYESFFGEIIDFLGSPPAAPVFMFTMGVFFMFSSKASNLKDGIIRGLKLFLLGCILSFLRDDLLVLLNCNLTRMDYVSANKLMGIWEVDILQFAGLAYIFMSFIKYYFKKPIWWLVIAVFVMIVSPFLWEYPQM
ncbi:heparan-alpha-glucosaminide N-acetyltransferase domain-containing protein [Oceanirhabdus sp. W0125-5]|uniref:heparan-alpha-glucosaminide N-acetyltransferase domain-containing protein n=1 Tax=Oceanirhabdus sp. W0125-5 TaxID=2999116 RepID=UPI0022F2D782|nr:heparan-alpha-glucosaminide N-acetyltransferase domain-containing protein [Oceanirhabdus sp. W0125-5]WBW96360.1 heparan-alpha-glucosaminide N-acetyltransferase domain-containing protein [Oceanirhabdus sp. W0125-5]